MGQALGVAVSGSILNANARGLVAATFVDASRPAWLVLTGCGCVVLLLGLAARRTRSPHITARLDAEVPQAVRAREREPRPELETQADQVPQADPWPWTPGDQEAWIPEDQQAPPESAWIPRYLISQQPPAYFAPESRDPLVIIQGDHPYYRRLRQAQDEQE
jgi:hypothetical protein